MSSKIELNETSRDIVKVLCGQPVHKTEALHASLQDTYVRLHMCRAGLERYKQLYLARLRKKQSTSRIK